MANSKILRGYPVLANFSTKTIEGILYSLFGTLNKYDLALNSNI